MGDDVREIVRHLNAPPFEKGLTLISFDSLLPMALLRLLNDVLGEISEVRSPALSYLLCLMYAICYSLAILALGFPLIIAFVVILLGFSYNPPTNSLMATEQGGFA